MTSMDKYFRRELLSGVPGTLIVNLLLFLPLNFAGADTTVTPDSLYNLFVSRIDGEKQDLSAYSGKVLLIANTASRCGYTPQYADLQQLHEKYSEQGLVVLGFPSNDFMGQEPGTNEEIQAFCSSTYDVTFPLFEKAPVSGENIQPLFEHLTAHAPDPGEVKWNFEKFVVDREGKVVARFRSPTRPTDPKVVSRLEELLTRK